MVGRERCARDRDGSDSCEDSESREDAPSHCWTVTGPARAWGSDGHRSDLQCVGDGARVIRRVGGATPRTRYRIPAGADWRLGARFPSRCNAGPFCVSDQVLTMRQLALVTFLAAATQSTAQQPDGWAGYTAAMQRFVDTRGVVGAATVWVADGRVVAHREFGYADRDRKTPITEASIFHWGSITKTLTTIAVMQLVERGQLSLDDKVTRWIPELRQVHNPHGSMDDLTVRMLLTHSSGLQNPTWPYGRGRSWEPFEPTRWEQLVSMMPYQSLLFQPGSRYGYSNPAFIYAARILELITGDPYQAYIYKNLWTPLGLTTSYFGATPYHLTDARSHNYTIEKDSAGRVSTRDNGKEFDPGITIPNGGWNAPLSDLATYIGYLTGSSGATAGKAVVPLLKRTTLEEMFKPVVTAGLSTDGSAAMGLGFFLWRNGSSWLIGHTGQQAGFLSYMYFDPATRRGVIGAINTWDDANSTPFSNDFTALGNHARSLLAKPAP
jgi:CubicO group peptidase (beta-lactamase class C family)